MESKLTGIAALVTGASSGIGAATARKLAENSVTDTPPLLGPRAISGGGRRSRPR